MQTHSGRERCGRNVAGGGMRPFRMESVVWKLGFVLACAGADRQKLEYEVFAMDDVHPASRSHPVMVRM